MNEKERCELKWIRTTKDGDAHEERIPNAVWIRRGNSQYINFEEVIDGVGDVRTTLRLDGERLTWIRHGAIQWTHTFEAGKRHVSHMHLLGQKVEICTLTNELEVTLTSTRGVVTVACEMRRDEDTEHVELSFEFQLTDV